MKDDVPQSQEVVIAALLTSFNRRTKTLQCLSELAKQLLPKGHRIEVFLVDDRSSDGTGDAVRREFPSVNLIEGTGALYWCGGMRLAWRTAAKIDPDYYLAVNDDTIIVDNALMELLSIVSSPQERVIAVAAIADPTTGLPNYGGRGRDVSKDPLVPTGVATRCETGNGNCLLIPRVVYQEVGMFYPYTHGMADYDYGFTATRRGIAMWQSGRFLGTCARNPVAGTWHDTSLSRRERLRKLLAPTGLPWRDYLTYRLRHNPWTWPRYLLGPFVRILLGR